MSRDVLDVHGIDALLDRFRARKRDEEALRESAATWEVDPTPRGALACLPPLCRRGLDVARLDDTTELATRVVVDAALHQDVLDELAGRIIDGRRNDSPISNPIGYLAKLASVAREGAFVFTSFGLRTRDGRRRAQQIAKHNEEAERNALARLEAHLETVDSPALRNRTSRRRRTS